MVVSYKPRLTTTDLWSDLPNHVGSDRHASLLDKLAACRSYEDEQLLQLSEGGHTVAECAAQLGLTQFAVQERIRRINRSAR